MAVDPILSWGYDNGTSQAPYYLIFNCYEYPRTSKQRANLGDPKQRIILPGVRITRGTAHRYSEDAPMMENLTQALGTIGEFDPASLSDNPSLGDLLGAIESTLVNVSNTFQGDAFGQVTSNLGRLELLTTEAGYLGSSKRKYSFSWNLKSTSIEANTNIARTIGERFETLSMPVVGSFPGEGNIAQASRMRPPNIWTVSAVNEFGANEAEVTSLWLGTPKLCVLQSVVHGLDNQSFIAGEGGPFSYSLSTQFVELENVFNFRDIQTSRSEFFDQIGSG